MICMEDLDKIDDIFGCHFLGKRALYMCLA